MKVVAITKTLAELSGWGRYAASVAREYAKQGVDFCVLTETNGLPPRPEFHEKAIIVPLKSCFVNFIRNCWRTRVTARDADVIHAFDGWPYSVYAYSAVIGTKKKLFITGVATYSVAPFEHSKERWLLAKAYRRAQQIFCVSRYTEKRILEKISLKNTSIVPWGPKPLPALSADAMTQYRQRFNIQTGQPIILTVGEIKQRKGQYDTARAILRLRKSYPDVLYIMVGGISDSNYVNKIEQFVEKNNLVNNIRIVADAATDHDLAFFYSICDIFAMNSNNDGEHFEGFGLVFLEAMQFGKPVVGSLGCGIEDAIQDDYNGYLTSQGDDVAICQAFQRILTGNMNMLRDNARNKYGNFSWEKTVAEYIRNYYL